MMRRRSFLHALFGVPALTFIRPRMTQAQTSDPPWYSDDLSTANLAPVHDSDLATGIEYTHD